MLHRCHWAPAGNLYLPEDLYLPKNDWQVIQILSEGIAGDVGDPVIYSRSKQKKITDKVTTVLLD